MRGNVTKFEQDLNSSVGASGSVDDYEFASTYDDFTTGRNTLRRTQVTLPGGRVITPDYSLNKDGSLSRVSKLKDGATTLVTYDYLGAGFEIGETYNQPGVYGKAYGSTSGSYPDLDRFNRITRSDWTSDVEIPVNFYDCEVSYDRNSNITWVEDNVHSGFDVKYTMDDLDRLIDADEGTRSGSSITSRTRHQTWLQSGTSQLSHTGNWARSKLDLDGDDNWNETDEYDDTRTHNKVNELTARDTDTSGTNNYTLSYDAAGDLTDDGESYKYEYDAFYRLRKVKSQSSTLLAEYRYNGLGHMIGVHEDTDADGDADGSDVWFYPAYDEAWREVARYRENDSSPKEQFVNALAGLDGYGESSYINDVVCRNRDNTSGWLAASDGTLEERYYYCPNWRGDVSALVTSGRKLHEWGKFSPYGLPNCLPGADTNSDGDCDENDINQIDTWRTANPSHYDVRGDVDLDHELDATDESLASAAPLNASTYLGWGVLSNAGIRNRIGYAGYVHSDVLSKIMHVRHRTFSGDLGRWSQRDPVSYADGPNSYQYAAGRSTRAVDPYGLQHGPPDDRYPPVQLPPDPPDPPDPCDESPRARCLCNVKDAYDDCVDKAKKDRRDCRYKALSAAPITSLLGVLGGVSPSLQQDLDDCQDQYTDDMNDCGFSRLVAEALCNLL